MKAMLSLSARVPCWLGDVTATCRPTGALHVGGWIDVFIATVSHLPSHSGDVYFLW